MITKKDKKAVSPIITTVLLILVVIILAVVIFLWATKYGTEIITKFYGGEEKDISVVCRDIKFSAQFGGNKLSFINQGDFPIYRFDIIVVGSARSDTISTSKINLESGASKTVDFSASSGEQLKIIPVLLGKDKSGELKEASCLNSEVWQNIEI